MLIGKQSGVTIALASFDPDAQNPMYRRLSISNRLANDFRDLAITFLAKYRQGHADGDLQLLPHAGGYKPEDHQIEYIETGEMVIEDRLFAVPARPQLVDDLNEFLPSVRFYVLQFRLPRTNGCAFSKV